MLLILCLKPSSSDLSPPTSVKPLQAQFVFISAMLVFPSSQESAFCPPPGFAQTTSHCMWPTHPPLVFLLCIHNISFFTAPFPTHPFQEALLCAFTQSPFVTFWHLIKWIVTLGLSPEPLQGPCFQPGCLHLNGPQAPETQNDPGKFIPSLSLRFFSLWLPYFFSHITTLLVTQAQNPRVICDSSLSLIPYISSVTKLFQFYLCRVSWIHFLLFLLTSMALALISWGLSLHLFATRHCWLPSPQPFLNPSLPTSWSISILFLEMLSVLGVVTKGANVIPKMFITVISKTYSGIWRNIFKV